jgi:hypothetical protein
MTIRDLISELEMAAECVGDMTEVRLATAPNWSMEWTLGVATVDPSEEPDYDESDEESTEIPSEEQTPVVYITEGTWIGYLPGVAARQIGWGGR